MVSFTFLSGLSTTLEFCQLVRGFPSPTLPLLLLTIVFVGITRKKKILIVWSTFLGMTLQVFEH